MPTIVGKDHKHVHRVTCRHCASVLEYTLSEVKTQDNGRDISGGPDGHEYIICPSCASKVIIRAW